MALQSSPSPQRGISAVTDGSQCIRASASLAAWMGALGDTEIPSDLNLGMGTPTTPPLPYVNHSHLPYGKPARMTSIFVALILSEFSIL